MFIQRVYRSITRFNGSLGHHTFQSARYSSTFNQSMQREELLNHPGGRVDLIKDENAGIASIVLNHENRKNAMSGQMMVDMADIVTELEKWQEGRGVLMYGIGNTFCSGGDLNLMQRILNPVSGAKMCLFMQNVLTRLYKLPLVSVALLEGQALGGGAELATSCDFRLVTERLSIGFVQVKLGVSPGWGGGARLVQLIGRTKALELLMSGHILSWREALDIGLADGVIRVEEGADPVLGAKSWLLERLPGNVSATRAAKKTVVAAMDHSLLDALQIEKDIFASVWGSPEHSEAASKGIKHK